MKVYVLYGSPHKKGETAKLLEEYLKTLPEEAEVIKTDAYMLNPSPCNDCGACKKLGICLQRDMDYIYDELEDCDVVVFASPVYNLSFPAPMKALLDRFQIYFNRRFVKNVTPIEKPREAVILLTYGSEKYGGADSAVTALKMICTVLNATVTNIETKLVSDL